ncbi:MAG: sulfate reduction electron transfer complex DsrMKJOP subunit DsrM, partial [Calditrichaeota bacterium]|nr:sulfate reduction electron transfer complex DsrMKJOP subunit DsrM [Calditrichota bacterium]
MNALISFVAVIVLIIIPFVGAQTLGLSYLFAVIIPYLAITIFLLGFVFRVIKWARAPVPFRIPTTCGQQKSLPWIKNSPIENPHNMLGVIVRMALEVLFFRSLFKNTKTTLQDGPKLVYGMNQLLWLGGLLFHWSFLIIFIRHFRFFMEPVPWVITAMENLDGILEVGLPVVFMTDVFLIAAVTYLVIRRITDSKLRYISLAADFFPLFLILGIAVTGVLMRYFTKVDIVGVKDIALGLFSFNPVAPEGISSLFYIHLFMVCVLISYFPLSKLMHMGGIFLSPTRNLANNNRMKRHINPWNPKVKMHTYEEYEDEFREVMRDAGMPLDKE